jgi:hypothetical protein
MKAMMICSNTRELLTERKEIHGVVHSVFHKVCNIETKEGEIIPLISQGIPKMPRCISVKIPQEQTMHSMGFVKGTNIIFYKDSMRAMDTGFELDFHDAITWDGKPKLYFAPLEERYTLENITRLRKVMLQHGRLWGIGALLFLVDKNLKGMPYPEDLWVNPYCEFIGPRIMKLIQGLLSDNLMEAQNMGKQIIGFGLGLTPSADDLLAGLMTALVYGGSYYGIDLTEIMKMNQAIIRGTTHRTTKISSEMLCFAAKGEAAENIRQLLVDVFSEKNEIKINQDILSVIENGDTSGTDCVAGIYIGCLLSQLKSEERKMRE